MSKFLSNRTLVIVSTILALLLVVIGLNMPTRALAKVVGNGYEAEVEDEELPPTPENGGRNCAMSKIVGYVMENGEQQFYYVSDDLSTKIGGLSVDVMRTFLGSAVGATVTITGPDGSTLTLTNQGGGVFTGAYQDADMICSRPDLKE